MDMAVQTGPSIAGSDAGELPHLNAHQPGGLWLTPALLEMQM